ncbi:unnamed protein product [Effrenium voratum]|nr:unnamed protein product [Effrenium voratum]
MALRCGVLLGSPNLSKSKMGRACAEFLRTRLEDADSRMGCEVAGLKQIDRGMSADLDLFEAEEDFVQQMLRRPNFHMPGEPAPLLRLRQRLSDCDAFVLAAPDGGAVPEVFELLLPQLGGSELFGLRPTGICVYSSWSPSDLALRQFLSALGALPLPEALRVPRVHNQFAHGADTAMQQSCDTMLDQLEWHARAMKTHREAFGGPSPAYFTRARWS